MAQKKTQDMKMTDRFASHENTGHETAGYDISGHKSAVLMCIRVKITAKH